MRKIKLQITGIHCKSCKALIEEEVSLIIGIKSIEVNTKTGEAWVVYDENETHKDEIIKTIEHLNYEAKLIKYFKISKNSLDSSVKPRNDKLFNKLVIPFIAVLIFGFIYLLISRFGLFEFMEKLNESNLSYGLIFVIGLLASFHCIGM